MHGNAPMNIKWDYIVVILVIVIGFYVGMVSATAPDGIVVIEADDATAAGIAQSFVGTVLVVSASAGAAWAEPELS